MPWFRVPFILTDTPTTKTDKYDYHQVTWTNNIFSPAITRISVTGGSFPTWYYNGYGVNFDSGGYSGSTTISDITKLTPPKVNVESAECTVVSASMIPSTYQSGHTMRYVLKFKRNPNSPNKVAKFRMCRQYKEVSLIKQHVISSASGTYSWYYHTADDRTPGYCNMFVQQGEDAVITTTRIEGADFEKMTYASWNDGTKATDYDTLATGTDYRLFTVDLSKPGSYAYLVVEIGSSNLWEDRQKRYFGNGQQTYCDCYMSMELEHEDDIIFGEGFSLIYVGERFIDAGMINKGVNAPSAIYVGENMVWSN